MDRGVRSFILSAVVVLALAVPSWAAHKDSTQWTVTDTATIGSSTITPGDYQIRAEEGGNQLEVLKAGNVVATVPCHWVHLNQKAEYTEVLIESNNVSEIHFAGKTEAIKIDSGMEPQKQQ
ncbi:MAG: hypothetical protein WAK91_16400 [Candidatus Acidiferrales bacterium]|jgi:hypothetical protein